MQVIEEKKNIAVRGGTRPPTTISIFSVVSFRVMPKLEEFQGIPKLF